MRSTFFYRNLDIQTNFNEAIVTSASTWCRRHGSIRGSEDEQNLRASRSASRVRLRSGVIIMIRVLVVDDDPFIGMLALATLSGPSRQIVTVQTGAKALETLTDPPPDLVLLDVGLPDVSGFEVLRILRGAPAWADVRILMFTASHEMDDIVRAKALGASGYICKPVKPETLEQMVDDILTDGTLSWLDDYTRSRRQA